MDDAILVSRAVGGDRDSFAAIYDRYAGAVLDLCTAVLRNEDAAIDATLDSFLRAAHELVNLRDRSQLRLWLLAVARHEATARAEKRRQDGLPELTGAALGGPGATAATAGDPRRPVWDPAEALSERDRAILHLHLRHELEGEELAAVVGVRPAVAEARAAKLRGMAETSVGAYLLTSTDAGTEPSTCAGLARVLEGWDGRFTPAVGAKVNRHAQGCDVCRARRTMLLGRLRAMASLPFVPPPPWLRQEVLLRMELAVSSRTLPGWDESGFPPGVAGAVRRPDRSRPPQRRRSTVAVLTAVAALAGAGALLVTRDWDGDSTVSASASSTTTPTSAPGPTSTTPTPASTVTTPATTIFPIPTTGGTVAPTVPVTAAPLPPPPQPGPDRDPPAIAFGAEAASAYVSGCPYSRTNVVADISDASDLSWVALFVRRPDGVEESANMAFDGRWVASMGDFDTPGQAVFWVEAIDTQGNRGRAGDQVLDVFPCT